MSNIIYDEKSACCNEPVRFYSSNVPAHCKEHESLELFYFSCTKCKAPCHCKKKAKKHDK